jgi:hypothetical protein
LQKVTWTANRVVRVGDLTAWWAGIEVRLLGIAASVRAETCRQRVNESATPTALATSAATSTADAAAWRTAIGAIAAMAITESVAVPVATEQTTLTQSTAIAVASVGTACITTAWITAFFAATTWVADAALGFAANVATTTWVTTALAGESAVSTTACRQAEHGNDNHELFHQKSP